jgi:hypothetical protein
VPRNDRTPEPDPGGRCHRRERPGPARCQAARAAASLQRDESVHRCSIRSRLPGSAASDSDQRTRPRPQLGRHRPAAEDRSPPRRQFGCRCRATTTMAADQPHARQARPGPKCRGSETAALQGRRPWLRAAHWPNRRRRQPVGGPDRSRRQPSRCCASIRSAGIGWRGPFQRSVLRKVPHSSSDRRPF